MLWIRPKLCKSHNTNTRHTTPTMMFLNGAGMGTCSTSHTTNPNTAIATINSINPIFYRLPIKLLTQKLNLKPVSPTTQFLRLRSPAVIPFAATLAVDKTILVDILVITQRRCCLFHPVTCCHSYCAPNRPCITFFATRVHHASTF